MGVGLGVALGVLALGAFAWALLRAHPKPPPEAESPTLPRIAGPPGEAARITKIVLTRPDDDDRSVLDHVVLEKVGRAGRDWEITSPERTRASDPKVQSLIDNLEALALRELVTPGTASYDASELTAAKAQHVVAFAGTDVLRDLYFGKSVPGGQLVRVAGIDDVFAIGNSGPGSYSGFLYTRSFRSWRETSIFQFKAEDVASVDITNRNGVFAFARGGGTWTASIARRSQDGTLGPPAPRGSAFDPNRVDDLLRVYQSLSADDFGREKDRAASGVDNAEETGGVIRIRLAGDPVERTIRIGNVAETNTRWSIKDSRWAIVPGGDGTLYALSPFTSGWAAVGVHAFDRDPKKRASP